jgi:hypothetical protein
VTNFTADPNPVTVYDGSFSTISVTANCTFDVRAGAPNGTLLDTGTGIATVQASLSNTTTFYLQRHADTTAAGTLQTLPVLIRSGTLPCQVFGFAATPNPIISSTLSGSTTVSGVATCPFTIRVGSPRGKILANSTDSSCLVSVLGPTCDYVASATTNDSITNGTQFFMVGNLIDPGTFASFTERVLKSVPECDVVEFSAYPERIVTVNPPASTTITAEAGCAFDIRIGGPSGSLLTSGAGYVSEQTGISNETTFYLQMAGDTTAAGTLRTVTVRLMPSSLKPTPGRGRTSAKSGAMNSKTE